MKQLALLMLTLLVLSACGQSTSAPTPTAQPSAAFTATTAEILPALRKTVAATHYQILFDLQGAGSVGTMDLGEAQTPKELISFNGRFAGEAYQFTLKGFLADFLGANPERGLEVVHVNSTSYIHGPLAFVDAFDEGWYRLGAVEAAIGQPPVNAEQTFSGLASDTVDFSQLTSGEGVTLHSQACQSFQGDREATISLLQQINAAGLPAQSDPAQIEEASSEIVLCADGYIHQIDLGFSGTSTVEAEAKPFHYWLHTELSDFASELAISPPEAVRELPNSSLPTTPVP